MITSSDEDYKDTKLIKQGKKKLETSFKEFAKWINEKFEVNVLNIYYDRIQHENRPRLNVIFEFSKDEKKFRTEPYGMYDAEKQQILAGKFKLLLESKRLNKKELFLKLFNNKSVLKYDTKNIFVVFSSFELIAISEANNSIPQEKIQELKIKIGNKDLWEISRFFSSTTFFFYTDNQVKENSCNVMLEKLTEEYYKLLKVYD